MINITCDKCKIPTKHSKELGMYKYERGFKLIDTFHLCPKCNKSFKKFAEKWFKMVNDVPPQKPNEDIVFR